MASLSSIKEDEFDVTQLIIEGKTNCLSKRFLNFPDLMYQQNDRGDYPAHTACQYGRSDAVMLLNRLGCHLDEQYNSFGYLPIHTACQYCQVDCVVALWLCGADLNAVTQSDYLTPLHIVCQNGYAPIVRILLRYKVKTNAKDVYGYTPLMTAMIHGHQSVLDILYKPKQPALSRCGCIQFV
ncbi:unnamed protein product [Calicophoron daubneyi]|uniref:Uncharacterized protein n=1 Tax=Calicophoron daubneyi TaxID=300641 RepID=A0AAV2TXN0_CALDB